MQVVYVALGFIVPAAIIWAFKKKPDNSSGVENVSSVTPKKKRMKKDNYMYDVFVLRRYGKR